MPIQGNFAAEIRAMVTNLVDADKMNIGNAIFQSVFGIDDFTRYHQLVTGVRDGGKVPIILAGNDYGSMPAGDEKSCEFNECDVDIQYSSQTWSLGEYNCKIPICLRTLDEDFLVFWNMYRQRLEDPLERPDYKAFLSFLTEKVENRIKGTQWRVGYLGDKSSTNNLINNNNGYFVQAEAGSGTKINLPQANPTPEEIYEALTEAYNAASEKVWFSEKDVVWRMTYAMAAKFVAFLNTKADLSQYNCDCINPDALTTGRRFKVEGLTIYGIPVHAHREIDGSMAAVSQTNKFQALLIRESNQLLGTNETDNLSEFDIWYSKDDKKIYIESLVYMGVSIPLEDEYVFITNEVTP
ncbi:hypothetical protein [Paenimyroides ceti]